jgi:micrococcal nuclease
VSAKPVPAPINTLEGLVVGVTEGDHITVNSFGTEIDVLLYGIAAPQTAKVDKFTGWYKPGQPYAEEAFRALSIKVLHQQVKVEIRRTIVNERNSKQLALAVIYLGGRNINLEMAADGWAWVYKKLIDRKDLPEYLAAEKHARTKKHGLWLQENPLAPWEFKPKVTVRNKRG